MYHITYVKEMRVKVIFTAAEGIQLNAWDNGTLDDIIESAASIMKTHNFQLAEIIDRVTDELLVSIEGPDL